MNRREFLKTSLMVTAAAAGTAYLGGSLLTAASAQNSNTGERNVKIKILVITGSPRKNGNSNTLAEHFIKGAQEAGHEVVRFNAAFKQVHPCIGCNRYVKWESLLERSLEIGADYIATGHYARIDRLPNGRFAIRNSVTAAKDQTYALYNLTQDQLSHTLMPVGEYTKDEIRVLAEEAGLPVAHKPDSQEICFVPDNDYAGFIEREASDVPGCGNFVD